MTDLHEPKSLPRLILPAEYRADPGAVVAATPRPGARETFWARMRRWNDWLENSWVGDLIGAICVFVIGYGAIIIGWVLE